MDGQLRKARLLVSRKRYAEAFDLLKQADAKDDYAATYALGTWYIHGRFVQKDLQKAFRCFSRATKGNIPDAYFDLAICYEKGEGTPKDLKKAFNAYVAASNLGDRSATYEVVRCLYHGIGTEKNVGLSRLLYNQNFKGNSLSSPSKTRPHRSLHINNAMVA